MPFNLNISMEGLWPTVNITNTIPEDFANISRSLKMAALDIVEAQIRAEKKALLPADEKAELLAQITKLEAEIKGRQNIVKPAKRSRGRSKKASEKVVIDYQDLDNEEIRDYMAGKSHLMADPRF